MSFFVSSNHSFKNGSVEFFFKKNVTGIQASLKLAIIEFMGESNSSLVHKTDFVQKVPNDTNGYSRLCFNFYNRKAGLEVIKVVISSV